MLRIPRRKLLASVLTVLLAFSLALPAAATPLEAMGTSILSLLQSWLGWPSAEPVRAATDKSSAYSEPNPTDQIMLTAPDPISPDAPSAQTLLDASGDAHPGMDPDG